MALIFESFPYALYPEWHAQSAVMLTWPSMHTIWAETLDAINEVFCEVSKQISLQEKVIIGCYDDSHKKHILKNLQEHNVNLSQIHIYIAPCDDIWVRDHGPITVKNLATNQPVLLDFIFNGWGDKYPAGQDNQITGLLNLQSAFGKNFVHTVDLVLEGGAIEVDGQGTLLTTSSCLLSQTRNPHLNKDELMQRLGNLFGIKKFLWLDHGYLAGDDTDGHIDTLARFVNDTTICYVTCNDPDDEHYTALKNMEAQLKTFTDFRNQPYHLIPLPWPQKQFAYYDERRLPATYANFLIINNTVLVPTYDDPADQEALSILEHCFPDRKIIGINCLPVIQWYGSLHCMTMQLPEGVVI